MDFANKLIDWYLENKRELPWRNTRDPYHIWLSEIMLQQTRIAQGLPYFLKFTEAYPTVFDLANASEDEVLKLWQGLGYYSRARNLHATAKHVAFTLNGVFPKTYTGLIELKGVGEYTGSAVASFAYGEPVAVVDGNVYRVLARVFNIDTPINSGKGIKEFRDLARELLDENDPATYNQAIMEFGALQCKPQQPLCETCPLNNMCLALKYNKTGSLPVKLKKGKIKERYFNYLVLLDNNNKTILEQRTGKGIWEGLYQFPLVETETEIKVEDIPSLKEFKAHVGEENSLITPYNNFPIVHKLSHQHIHTRFWIIEKKLLEGEVIDVKNIADYPVPVLIANFLNEFDF